MSSEKGDGNAKKGKATGNGSRKKKSNYTKTHSYQKRANLTKQNAIETLKKTFGNVSMTCERLGLSRQTFYKWRNEDPEFNAAVEDINERTLDFVESKMFEGINAGNTRLIMFYLNCKGKKRGYGLKEEEKNPAIVLKISPEEAEY